jgi:hypothetical protein
MIAHWFYGAQARYFDRTVAPRVHNIGQALAQIRRGQADFGDLCGGGEPPINTEIPGSPALIGSTRCRILRKAIVRVLQGTLRSSQPPRIEGKEGAG